MEDVNNVLDIAKDDTLCGEVITLADSTADGTFLIHHFLSFFLGNDRPVCFVSLAQSFGHHKSVCQKLGINLPQKIESSHLNFFDGLKEFGNVFLDVLPENADVSCCSSLQGLYKAIKTNYKDLQDKNGAPPVVIIDSLNVLLNIGYQVKEITAFVQYLCQLISDPDCDARGTLVTFLSRGENGLDEEASLLWRSVVHMSNMDVHVSGLESGYCKDVHGKIEVRRRNLLKRGSQKTMQFKVNDKSVEFFASGMSRAVLG